MSEKFNQNTKLGVLGGGQLGRMLLQSAIDFNLEVAIIDPDENAPCKNLTSSFTVGSLKDFDTVYGFGQSCDLITIEIENVNTEALQRLADEGKQVFPQPSVIRLIQNKVKQKRFYVENGIPTAPFVEVAGMEDLKAQEAMLPAVNKLATEGYDGRGVQILKSKDDIEKGFDKEGLLEELISFDKEISIIVARNQAGEMQTFPAVELVYHPEANLVEYLFAPATISEETARKAADIAKSVIEKLGMTGLLAVEMFALKNGEVLVNEIAPRTHNSGHQTIEANITSQFEQHLRAILNWPLGDTSATIPSAMVNLLGEDGYTGQAKYVGMDEVLAIEGAHVHLYGKKLTKPFRKMGHVTIVDNDVARLREKAQFVKSKLKIIA